jgi:hypothetical protein
MSRWKAANPEKVEAHRQRERNKHRALRRELLSAYGGLECKCCGETFLEFLTLDHVEGGGTKHRRESGLAGVNLYVQLKREGFPDPHLYRVLCSNCNFALSRADNTFESLREAVMHHRGIESPAA